MSYKQYKTKKTIGDELRRRIVTPSPPLLSSARSLSLSTTYSSTTTREVASGRKKVTFGNHQSSQIGRKRWTHLDEDDNNDDDDDDVLVVNTIPAPTTKRSCIQLDQDVDDDKEEENGTNSTRTLLVPMTNQPSDSNIPSQTNVMYIQRNNATPSPPRVVLDLMDATCHEIIHLGGDISMHSINDDGKEENGFVMPTLESYSELSLNFGYYMDLFQRGRVAMQQQLLQNPHTPQKEDDFVLEKGTNNWLRFVMAKLILDIFTKVEYEHDAFIVEDHGQQQQQQQQQQHPQPQQLCPKVLMNMSPSRWSKLRWVYTELRDAFHGRSERVVALSAERPSVHGQRNKRTRRLLGNLVHKPSLLWDGVQSTICVMEGFEAWALLRKQLRSLVTRMQSSSSTANHDIRGYRNHDDVVTIDHIVHCVEQYKATSKRIQDILRKEQSWKYYDNLFIPIERVNVRQYPSTHEGLKNSIIAICDIIHDTLFLQRFPVQQFKFVLLSTLKEWESLYLPKPVLFTNTQYFKYREEDAPLLSINQPDNKSHHENGGMTPEKHYATVSNFSSYNAPYSQAAGNSTNFRGTGSIAQNQQRSVSAYYLSSDAESHSQDKTICPKIEYCLKTKKKKRCPLTDVERECLLEGVNKFGVGQWVKILNHYIDVFSVNSRTSVHLKDHYRNLMKKTEP